MKLSEIYKEKNNFDFVRFVLASLVLYSHSFYLYTGKQHSENKGEIIYTLTNGQLDGGSLAVNMFFVISGFLITMSWFNNPSIYAYSIKRLFRIFPGLLGVTIFVVIIMAPLISHNLVEYYNNLLFKNIIKDLLNMTISPDTVQNIFSSLYSKAINGSLWTLRYEVCCYILILILGFTKLLNKLIVILLFVAFFSIYILQTYGYLDLTRGAIPVPRLFSYFLLGTLLYFFKDDIIFSKKYIILSCVLLIIFIKLGILNAYIIFGLSYLLFAFIYSSTIKLHNFGKYGDLSYGIYIYAFPLQQLTLYLFRDISFIMYMAVSFAMTISMSFLSWHLIEKTSLNFVHSKKIIYLFKKEKYVNSK